VTIIPVTIAEPDVFGDYFDDGMKLVDISQDAALRSCLSDGKTADKTKAAYDGCYGQGYDFDDLAKAGGDDDGLPDELEEKEGCFYKKMGWVSEDNVMDEAAIAADMEGLEKEIQDGFLSDVGTCVAWSGNFGERRKREAGMEVQGETQDRELVPGLMDTGRRAMGWVRKLVRKVRSPGKGRSKNGKKCPTGKEGKKCREKKRNNRKPKRGKQGKNGRNGQGAGRRKKKKGGLKRKKKGKKVTGSRRQKKRGKKVPKSKRQKKKGKKVPGRKRQKKNGKATGRKRKSSKKRPARNGRKNNRKKNPKKARNGNNGKKRKAKKEK